MKQVQAYIFGWAASALIALAPLPAYAAFEDLGAGARAAGMGHAFVAVADDVYAAYYNPAGLALLTRPELGASYNKLYSGLSDGSDLGMSYLGYAHPLSEGARGTIATAWNSFSLDTSLYREDSFYISYGRSVWQPSFGGQLMAGLSLKYLRSSFGGFAEAANATNGIIQTGTADPALGSSSHGAMDTDIGLLYRLDPHYALGLQIMHLNRPDMAFSSGDSDKLPRIIKLGGNYRSHLSNLTMQLDTQEAPDGGRDVTVAAGAERWFITRFSGDLAARGGLALGSREMKQLSLGFSYRTRRVRFDYGFALPIGTVSGTIGSHRLGMNYKFGRRADDEESIELLLEAMRELRDKAPVRVVTRVEGLSPQQKTAFDEHMAQSRALRGQAKYLDSREQLSRALAAAPASTELLTLFGRLNNVSQFYVSLPRYKKDPIEAALHRGIIAYLMGRNLEAVERVSFALKNRPKDGRIEKLLAHMELATGIKRVKGLGEKHKSLIIETKLTRADAALEAKKYRKAIELSLSVLREDDNNASAWQNLGAAYFALKDYDSSLRAWEMVYSLEKSPAARGAIRGYISTIKQIMKKKKIRRAELRRRGMRPLPKQTKLSGPEVTELFDQGVKYYTQREYKKAAEAFQAILDARPSHEEARRALIRVQEHLP